MVGTVVAVGTVVDMVVVVGSIAAAGSTVVVVASVVVAIVAVDIADMGLVVAALFTPFSTLHHTLSIQCVYLVKRSPIL